MVRTFIPTIRRRAGENVREQASTKEPDIKKEGCTKVSESVEISGYDIFGFSVSLEAAGEFGTFSNGAKWADVGLSLDVKVGLGIGGDLQVAGTKFTFPAELKGPQIAEKYEAHYVTAPDGTGALHLDKQKYFDLSVEPGFGETWGGSDKFGIVLFIEYGMEANATGADAYISFAYKFTNELRLNLAGVAVTFPTYFGEDDKTFKTPSLKW